MAKKPLFPVGFWSPDGAQNATSLDILCGRCGDGIKPSDPCYILARYKPARAESYRRLLNRIGRDLGTSRPYLCEACAYRFGNDAIHDAALWLERHLADGKEDGLLSREECLRYLDSL
jgi:hypothetical protein